MEPQRKLHIKRLSESLDKIPELLSKTVHDTEFKMWEERTERSLEAIFGSKHSYSYEFGSLIFQEPRVKLPGESWTREDQKNFERDMERAKGIITDALEEAGFVPETQKQGKVATPYATHQVVVNIVNTLSQTTNVTVSQILQNLNQLGLTVEQEKEARRLIEELDSEVKGEKKWSVIGKSLEGLKSLGKSVYQNVGLPLLLEIIKKELGI